MIKLKFFTLGVFGLTAFAAPALSADVDGVFNESFAAYVEQAREDWSIPGVAIGVVDADGNITTRTYGVREIDTNLDVNDNTSFGIASITKTFIMGAIAKLVEEEKLDWNDPVQKHLPEFKLADAYVSKHVTIADLLSHRSGFTTHGDWIEESPGLTQEEAIARMASLGQSHSFRTGGSYNSLGYVVLAEVIERVTGKEWDAYLDKAVWKPLGLKNAAGHAADFTKKENIVPTGDGWLDKVALGQSGLKTGQNVASPHVIWENYLKGEYYFDERELDVTLSHFHETGIEASQSAFASINDMMKWTYALMSGKSIQGKTFYNDKTVNEFRRVLSIDDEKWPTNWPQPSEIKRDGLHSVAYSPGLEIFRYSEHTLFGHSGSELGYEALMLFDPERRFGVVALVNNGRSWGSAFAIVQTVLDKIYGYEPKDWTELHFALNKRNYDDFFAIVKNTEAELKADESLPAIPSLDNLVGTYRNDHAGDIYIEKDGDVIKASTGKSFEMELKHVAGSSFFARVVGPIRYPMLLSFDEYEGDTPEALVLESAIFDRALDFQRVK